VFELLPITLILGHPHTTGKHHHILLHGGPLPSIVEQENVEVLKSKVQRGLATSIGLNQTGSS
jgi:hypothetical protein